MSPRELFKSCFVMELNQANASWNLTIQVTWKSNIIRIKIKAWMPLPSCAKDVLYIPLAVVHYIIWTQMVKFKSRTLQMSTNEEPAVPWASLPLPIVQCTFAHCCIKSSVYFPFVPAGTAVPVTSIMISSSASGLPAPPCLIPSSTINLLSFSKTQKNK